MLAAESKPQPKFDELDLPPSAGPSETSEATRGKAKETPAERWARQRRNMWIGFGVSSGLVVVNGLVLLSLSATAPSGWKGATILIGGLWSMPVWAAALSSTLAIGIAQGVHARRRPAELTLLRHREQPRLTFDPVGLRLRF